MNKNMLPIKTCPVCERPFRWRKKWRNEWPRVVYCSKKCIKKKNLCVKQKRAN